MPINNNYILCFDFETTGLDTKTCEPLEIGCLVIDPKTYKLLPDRFLSDIAPSEGTVIEPKALEVNGFTMDRIKAAPPQDIVWKQFQQFVSKYNVKGFNGAPIALGANIKAYDLPIADRLCQKYGMVDKEGKSKLFNKRYIHDIYEILFPWLESKDEPSSYGMDVLRDYFGLSRHKAHTALKDCEDVYKIYERFMMFMRNLSRRYNFKDAFKNEG